MPDLTDKRNDLIIICPDVPTMNAYETWYAGLKTDEKANFKVDGGKYIVSSIDPTGTFDTVRDALIKLVDDNAESPTSIVRLRFEGTTFSSITMLVAKPEEEPK